jgi:hypothetical protein
LFNLQSPRKASAGIFLASGRRTKTPSKTGFAAVFADRFAREAGLSAFDPQDLTRKLNSDKHSPHATGVSEIPRHFSR